MILKYKGYKVELEWAHYGNGNNALQLMSEEDGLVATASVNPGQILPPDLLAVKDYSENTGIAKWLNEQGIIKEKPEFHIPSGFVSIPVYELL